MPYVAENYVSVVNEFLEKIRPVGDFEPGNVRVKQAVLFRQSQEEREAQDARLKGVQDKYYRDIAEKEKRIEVLQKTIAEKDEALRLEIAQNQENIEQKNKKIKQKNEEIDTLGQQVMEEQDRISDLGAEIERLKAEIERLKAKIEEITKDTEELETGFVAQTRKVLDLENQNRQDEALAELDNKDFENRKALRQAAEIERYNENLKVSSSLFSQVLNYIIPAEPGATAVSTKDTADVPKKEYYLGELDKGKFLFIKDGEQYYRMKHLDEREEEPSTPENPTALYGSENEIWRQYALSKRLPRGNLKKINLELRLRLKTGSQKKNKSFPGASTLQLNKDELLELYKKGFRMPSIGYVNVYVKGNERLVLTVPLNLKADSTVQVGNKKIKARNVFETIKDYVYVDATRLSESTPQ